MALIRYLPKQGTKNSELPGLGGVYNPINLNLYNYAGNNPVYYTDPDGNEISTGTAVLLVVGGFTLIDMVDNCYTIYRRLGDNADASDYMTGITMSTITGPQSFASTVFPVVGRYTIGAENAALKEIMMQRLEQRHGLRGDEFDWGEVTLKSGIDLAFKAATHTVETKTDFEKLLKKGSETIGKTTINEIRSTLRNMQTNQEKQHGKENRNRSQKLQPGFSLFGQSAYRKSY